MERGDDRIMQDLFTNNPHTVSSSRILYTPSSFARTSLLHLQEIGSLTALKPHTSRRANLSSYLFFFVESGTGTLTYTGRDYALSPGDCVFIDCKTAYAHSTDEKLWSLKWHHFHGPSMANIYAKYIERGGQPAFRPTESNLEKMESCWQRLWETANSSDYIRDMKINEGLNTLLTLIMRESWNPTKRREGRKRQSCMDVKSYLDEHYAEKLTLEDLAGRFYMDKYYLAKCFKEEYGVTINQYLLQVRITKAKQMLRFTDEKIEVIGQECGIGEAAYFSRMFKKIEGISPSEYREMW